MVGGGETIYFAGTSATTLSCASESLLFQPGIGGQDVINGFGSTESMWLSHTNFASWSALQGHMTQSGANTVITLNASDTITLTNVTATSLTSSQFQFV